MSKRSGPGGRTIGILVAAIIALGGTLIGGQEVSRHGPDTDPEGDSGIDAPARISTCEHIPAEADKVIDAIERGGPFAHPEDDSRFGNYENVLPQEKLGYYREYTVDTPGVRHRGERRIVTGGGADGVVDEWYYTDDHYETFCELRRGAN